MAYQRVAALDWRRTNPLWRETAFVKEVRDGDGQPQFLADGKPKLDVSRSRTEIEATVARVMALCDIDGA